MVRILLHALILPAMLWLERRGGLRVAPVRAAATWYLLGVPLMAVEAYASGREWSGVLVQSLLVALFFLPPAWFAFRYARKRGGIGRPFLLFLGLSVLTGFIAAAFLAHAPLVVSGFTS